MLTYKNPSLGREILLAVISYYMKTLQELGHP